jgi:hypothetical protein
MRYPPCGPSSVGRPPLQTHRHPPCCGGVAATSLPRIRIRCRPQGWHGSHKPQVHGPPAQERTAHKRAIEFSTFRIQDNERSAARHVRIDFPSFAIRSLWIGVGLHPRSAAVFAGFAITGPWYGHLAKLMLVVSACCVRVSPGTSWSKDHYAQVHALRRNGRDRFPYTGLPEPRRHEPLSGWGAIADATRDKSKRTTNPHHTRDPPRLARQIDDRRKAGRWPASTARTVHA